MYYSKRNGVAQNSKKPNVVVPDLAFSNMLSGKGRSSFSSNLTARYYERELRSKTEIPRAFFKETPP
jgi:hypothetical protein